MTIREVLTQGQPNPPFDANTKMLDMTRLTELEAELDALLVKAVQTDLQPGQDVDALTNQYAIDIAQKAGLIVPKVCPTCNRSF